MRLTKNFSLHEFACRDGAPVPPEYIENVERLAQQLQALRHCLAAPIKITSGYRTPGYNAKVGGEAKSYHLRAMAADVVVVGHRPDIVHATIEALIWAGKMNQGGLGLYRGQGFVHYDIRGVKARWFK